MINNILLVGAGGFFGSIARYLVSILIPNAAHGFPWGTLTVNLLGCFIIGLLMGLPDRQTATSSNAMLFLSVGFCGGFTTFSTFSKESLALLQAGDYLLFALYCFCSVAIGILAVLAGFILTK